MSSVSVNSDPSISIDEKDEQHTETPRASSVVIHWHTVCVRFHTCTAVRCRFLPCPSDVNNFFYELRLSPTNTPDGLVDGTLLTQYTVISRVCLVQSHHTSVLVVDKLQRSRFKLSRKYLPREPDLRPFLLAQSCSWAWHRWLQWLRDVQNHQADHNASSVKNGKWHCLKFIPFGNNRPAKFSFKSNVEHLKAIQQCNLECDKGLDRLPSPRHSLSVFPFVSMI
jgi:hypothetical protein